MSSLKYATPLHLELKSSRLLLALLCFMHGGAALVLVIIPIPDWLSIVLIFLVALDLYLQINFHVLMRSKKSVVRLIWLESHRWQIFDCNGGCVEGDLLGQSYLHTGLVVLRFKTITKEHRAVVIFSDSVVAELHRKLRVRLRLQAYS